MKYHIGPLRLAEHDRWMQLWSEYQRFYGIELPASVTESAWQRLHNGRVHGLGARNSADELLGIVHFLFHEDTWSSAAGVLSAGPLCGLQAHAAPAAAAS